MNVSPQHIYFILFTLRFSNIPRGNFFKNIIRQKNLNLLWKINYADDLIGEKEKSRLLTEEMEATLQDIQNMYNLHNFILFLHPQLFLLAACIRKKTKKKNKQWVVRWRALFIFKSASYSYSNYFLLFSGTIVERKNEWMRKIFSFPSLKLLSTFFKKWREIQTVNFTFTTRWLTLPLSIDFK